MRTRLRRRWIGTLILVTVAFSPSVRADGGPPGDADPDTEIARRRFERGTGFYTDGKYSEAIIEFEAARRAKPSPAFDFNIARCHDRLEHAREAVDAYERYLAGAPSAADAVEVRARAAVLKQRLPAAPTAAPTNPSSTPGDAVPLLARRRVATWGVGVGGVAVLASSLAAGLVAHARYGDLKGKCAADGACNAATVPDAQGLIDGGRTAGLASDVLLGVGVAAVAVAVVLFFVEGRHPVEKRAWRLAPAAGGVGLALEAP